MKGHEEHDVQEVPDGTQVICFTCRTLYFMTGVTTIMTGASTTKRVSAILDCAPPSEPEPFIDF